jgi:regulator of RNase E activity RraA
MYASGTAVVGPLGHAHVVSVGTVVNIGGCEIAPGDHVVLDDSGCVRIKANELQEVLLAATEYEEAEEKVLSAITSGERLNSAYRHKADVVARLRR